jgi:hypothetical protein
MDFFFIDDAQQKRPSRPGMGPLIAAGGVHVPDEAIQDLESKVDVLCSEYGFPAEELFKWSPGKELWMYRNLVGKAREEFFAQVLSLAKDNGATAIIAIEDTSSRKATKAKSREIDLIQLFLERAHHHLASKNCKGIVIVAQPSGDRAEENKFLADCIETLKCGTDYVKPDRIALSVLSSPPKFIRLLQLADLVASCTTAYVAGENRYSPPTFSVLKQLLARESERIGGIGLKLHPDFKYGNLYYWLLGDTHIWKGNVGYPLPHLSLLYYTSPNEP